jgi:hypothetical protein
VAAPKLNFERRGCPVKKHKLLLSITIEMDQILFLGACAAIYTLVNFETSSSSLALDIAGSEPVLRRMSPKIRAHRRFGGAATI